MNTSVEKFRTEFTEATLNFLWHQWRRLGVAGSVKGADSWVIDPEPLLAFTTEVARHDARMFDEVLDWLVVNGRWINTQRFSTIICRDEIGDKAVAGAMASWLDEKDKSMKWRGLTARMKSYARKPVESLFRVPNIMATKLHGSAEDHFRRYGLMRPRIRTRGFAQPVNMKEPATLIFKSRAVFGIGIRADVIALLATSEGYHARRIAEILGYNHMRVQDVLSGLMEAGVVAMRPAGRTRQYRLARDKWWSALVEDQQRCPRWINWRPLVHGLTTIWRAAWALDVLRADDYIFSSEMRAAMQSVRDDLHAGGLGFDIEDDKGFIAEAYLPVFIRDIAAVMKVLAG